jgi:predicted RNA-binding protein with PUA-like domain
MVDVHFLYYFWLILPCSPGFMAPKRALIQVAVKSAKRARTGPTKHTSREFTAPKQTISDAAVNNEAANNISRSLYLLKSEPDEFGIDHLISLPDNTSRWDGIRNGQAKNILASMKLGDYALFYHSSAKSATGVYGVVEVCREPYPDPTAVDPSSKYYDPKSADDKNGTKKNKWLAVDVKLLEKWDVPVLLTELKNDMARDGPSSPIANMTLFKQSRLSVHRLTPQEWAHILSLRTR